MPTWVIYHPKSAFDTQQKQLLAESITELYHRRFGMPKFYATVIFSAGDDIFVGGQQTTDFVRIVISHIARESNRDESAAQATKTAFNNILRPFIESKGLNWELSYSDSPRLFWQINGMDPPLSGTEEEQLWVKENRAVPPEKTKKLPCSSCQP